MILAIYIIADRFFNGALGDRTSRRRTSLRGGVGADGARRIAEIEEDYDRLNEMHDPEFDMEIRHANAEVVG